MTHNRRNFIKSSSVAALAAPLLSSFRGYSANEEVRLGFIGAGGRAGELSEAYSKCKNAKIVMFADPDLSRAGNLAQHYQAQAVQDLRKVLDNPEIDAVVISTCNHWHCLAAIWALDAGKHVYVEKPLSHNQWEGRQLLNAAKRSKKIVQIGTQQRSDPMQEAAKRFLHEDNALGAIKFVQANRLGPRTSIGKNDTALSPPPNVDYNLWLGPAVDEPIYRDSFHYDWHWNWNTGNGEMGNWGVHILDDVRNVAYQDQVSTPKRIVGAGGRVGWNDAGTTPNVHFCLFETEKFPTLIALSNLNSQPQAKTSWSCPVNGKIKGPSSGYVIVCEGGYYLGQRGKGEAIDLDGKTIKEFKGGNFMNLHMQNFIDAVIANDSTQLNGGLENGHHSTGWCNLANIGVRAGKNYDTSRLAASSSLNAWGGLIDLMEKQLTPFDVNPDALVASPILTHDPITEQFIGENASIANEFLKRQYRAGFEVVAQTL